MAGRKRDVTIDLIVDDKQKSKMKGIGDEAAKTGGKFSGLATTVAGLGIGAAVVNFADESITAFSDLNESMNAVDVSFGESSEGIKALGEDAADSLGLSNAAFNTFAVQFSAFAKQIAGDGGDVTGVVSELSTRVSDFASVMNLDVAEAARLFQSGLAGETEPLRTYGIDLSATTVKAHALAVGIGDGSGELTEQEKILARHSALMKQTDQVAGDFTNTQDEFANATRRANAEIENQKAVLGEALVPIKNLGTEGATLFSQLAAQFGIAVQHITGDLSNAEAAVMDFEAINLKQLDTGEELVELWAKEGGELKEFLGIIQFSTEELQRMSGASDGVLLSMGLSRTEIAEWREEVDRAILSEAIMAEGARQLAIHQGEVAEETEGATEALNDQFDAVKAQTDPLFALIQKTNEAAESQKAMNDAAAEFTTDSPEYTAAALKYVQDNQEMVGAQIAFAEQSGMTRDQFEQSLRDMGIASETVIQTILGEYDKVNAYVFTTKDVLINISGKWVAGRPAGMPDYIWKNIQGFGGTDVVRAGGGPVMAGQTVTVGESGPETITLGSQANVTPAHRSGRGGGTEIIQVVLPGVGVIAEAIRRHDRSLLPR